MKNLSIWSLSLLAIGFASCSQEDMPEAVNLGGNATFTINLPAGIGSRQFSDGLTAENLEMAVYDAVTGDLVQTPTAVTFGNSLQTKVNFSLANGRAYKIAFFAHKSGDVYTFSPEGKTVTVDYTKMANYHLDDYDCFYTLYTTEVVTGPFNDDITLTRPVAQVNWGTSDIAHPGVVAPAAYDKDATTGEAKNIFTKVTAKAYTTFNLLDSDVDPDSETDVVLAYNQRPDGETFPVDPATYTYLSMNYLLVPVGGTNVDLTLESTNVAGAADDTPGMTKVLVTNAPLQANYRTNIYGPLLTSPAEFNVTKDEIFATPDNMIGLGEEVSEGLYYNKDAKLYTVTTKEAFTTVFADTKAIAGSTVSLACDIDMQNEEMEPINLWTPDKQITFDGKNHTISNVKIANSNGSQFNGLIGQMTGTVKNLTVENIETLDVTKRFTGVVAYVYGTVENVHVKNAKIVTTDGRVGAVVGAICEGQVINCSVEDSEVTGAWSVGGLCGAALEDNPNRIPQFINCHVKNVKVTNTGAYGGVYDKMVGVMVGNINTEGVTFTDCTITDCDSELPIYNTYCPYMWNGTMIKADIDEDGNPVAGE